MAQRITQYDFSDEAVKAWAEEGKWLKGALGKSSGTLVRMTDGESYWISKHTLKRDSGHVLFDACDQFPSIVS